MDAIIIGALIGGLVGLVISIPLIIRQRKINKGSGIAKKKSRFTALINFSGNFEAVSAQINGFLASKGYYSQSYGAETVYRNGSGMMTAGKFIKFSKAPDGILVEAFIIAYGSVELGLKGFTGIIPKKSLKKVVNEVINIIQSAEADKTYYSKY